MPHAPKPKITRQPREHATMCWHIEWRCCPHSGRTFFGRSFAGACADARMHANAHAALRAARTATPSPG